MKALTYKSDFEHFIFLFLLYLCEEVSIIINCICEPRVGSDRGKWQNIHSQVEIMR